MLAKYLHRPDVMAPPKVVIACDDEEESGDEDEGLGEEFVVGGINGGLDTTEQVLIGPNDVVKALRQFVEDNNQPSRYGSLISF